jgi:hypothetical protein
MRTKVLVAAMAVAVGGCVDHEEVGHNQAALEIDNGLTTNAMTVNALTLNALTLNALTLNALTLNALTLNALTLNALTLNALTLNALTLNGATDADLDRERARRADARKLLRYVYSCAMPESASMELAFPTAGDDGSTCDGGTLSADGASCSYGTLRGGLGLAPQWANGTCDESCQRWVSACVLARTNYWGVPVDISLRGAHPALTVSDEEKRLYPLREGTYYGNIFTTEAQPDGSTKHAPEYHACGGPGSNIPEVTSRFCSSGAQSCAITIEDNCACMEVDGSAFPQGYFTNVSSPEFFGQGLQFTCPNASPSCSGVDANGAMTGCHTADLTPYPESVTVFLKNEAICGNSVCEYGEEAETCPTDCVANTWAKRFKSTVLVNTAGVDILDDDSMVMAGNAESFYPVVLGTENLFPITQPNVNHGYVGRFSATGVHEWSRALIPTPSQPIDTPETPIARIAGGPGNTTVVIGNLWSAFCYWTYEPGVGIVTHGNCNEEMWITKLSATGSVVFAKSFPIGARPSVIGVSGLAVAPSGNIVIAGTFSATTNLGGVTLTHSDNGREDIFVAMLDPNGNALWGKTFASTNYTGFAMQDIARSVVLDPAGDVIVTAMFEGRDDWMAKLSRVDGQLLSSRHVGANVWALASAPDGMLYFGGTLTAAGDLGCGPIAAGSYVAAYAADGTCAWSRIIPGWVGSLSADGDAGVMVAGGFGGQVDFGAGVFDAGTRSDLYAMKLSPQGSMLWAKQFGGPLDDAFGGADIARGRVVITGALQASMLFEQILLTAGVASPPNGSEPSWWRDIFLGSFPDPANPSGSTVCGFTSGACIDREPPVITLPPTPIVDSSAFAYPAALVEATEAWMTIDHLLTAIDDVDGPVPVDCRRLDYAQQPILEVDPNALKVAGLGFNYFSCSATDRAGNVARERFTIRIRDTTPPTITHPTSLTVDATKLTGQTVPYQVTFSDAIEWRSDRSYCWPTQSEIFPIGTTIVNCHAEDRSGNVTNTTFPVLLRFNSTGLSPAAGTSYTRSATVTSTFKLLGGSAPITNLNAKLMIAPVVGGVVGAETAAGMFSYKPKTKDYAASLATRKLALGTWQLRAELGDGVSRTTTIVLR